MNKFNKKITIIGGGVSGITCALLLQKSGFKTEVITKEDLLVTKKDPRLASLFPAASVIPHSIEHPELNTLFKNSLLIFDLLYKRNFTGLTTHLHYELFPEDVPLPDYYHFLNNFEVLNQTDLKAAPSHPNIESDFGYRFDCFFADWPNYFPALIKLYLQSGGTINIKHIRRDQIRNINSDIIINCSELGGPELAGEKLEPVIYKGHLVNINGVPKLNNSSGRTVSYNLVPGQQYYRSEDGIPMDVYCYSREGNLVLGGSRFKGTISEEGTWIGEKTSEPRAMIGNQALPEQVISLNQEIIRHFFDVDISKYPERTAHIGYRFMGNKEEGLTLRSEEFDDKLLIHNYGHGGAGVTISWGCAVEVSNMISEYVTGSEIFPKEILKYFTI